MNKIGHTSDYKLFNKPFLSKRKLTQNIYLLQIKVYQQDCIVRKLSEKMQDKFEIFSYPFLNEKNPKIKKVILNWKYVSRDEQSFSFRKMKELEFIREFKIIMNIPEEKVFEITVKNTTLGIFDMYFSNMRHIRLFPSTVEKGIETWYFLFGTRNDALNYIDMLKELPETELLNYQIYEFPIFLPPERFIDIVNYYQSLKENISNKKIDILKNLFNKGYFEGKKLSEISKEMRLSKGYLSRVTNEIQRDLLRHFIKLMLAS